MIKDDYKMKAVFTLDDWEEAQATMKITMSVRRWGFIARDLQNDSVPSGEFRSLIQQLIQHAQEEFSRTVEFGEQK